MTTEVKTPSILERALVWEDHELKELTELGYDISDAFADMANEQDEDIVRAACDELLSHSKLPLLYRAQFLGYLAATESEGNISTMRERLLEAQSCINKLKDHVEASIGHDTRVETLVEGNRKSLEEVNAFSPEAAAPFTVALPTVPALPMPKPKRKRKSKSKSKNKNKAESPETPQEIVPAKTKEEKLKLIELAKKYAEEAKKYEQELQAEGELPLGDSKQDEKASDPAGNVEPKPVNGANGANRSNGVNGSNGVKGAESIDSSKVTGGDVKQDSRKQNLVDRSNGGPVGKKTSIKPKPENGLGVVGKSDKPQLWNPNTERPRPASRGGSNSASHIMKQRSAMANTPRDMRKSKSKASSQSLRAEYQAAETAMGTDAGSETAGADRKGKGKDVGPSDTSAGEGHE